MPSPVLTRTADLRAVFGSASSSVWVVTTELGGRPVGFTAISVASVSVDPPLLSFNVSKTSSSAGAVEVGRRFAVHLLGGHQEALARRFAGPAEQRFADGAAWAWGEDGVPALGGALARLSGPLTSLTDAGDSHLVLLGVERASAAEGAPLVHWNRTYAPAGAAR